MCAKYTQYKAYQYVGQYHKKQGEHSSEKQCEPVAKSKVYAPLLRHVYIRVPTCWNLQQYSVDIVK